MNFEIVWSVVIIAVPLKYERIFAAKKAGPLYRIYWTVIIQSTYVIITVDLDTTKHHMSLILVLGSAVVVMYSV